MWEYEMFACVCVNACYSAVICDHLLYTEVLTQT